MPKLEERFSKVYSKFKLHFYQEIFSRFQDREASLTTVETFAMEAIHALGSPTVHEFAAFMNVSSSNAAYKIASLVRKGYVEKVQSDQDGREYHLHPTQKYIDYYNVSNEYVHTVMERVRARLSPEDLAKLEDILEVMGEELMPEIVLPPARSDASGSAEA